MSLKMLLRLRTCSFQRREGDRPSEAVPKFLRQFLARVGVDILCSPPPKSELCAALQPNFAQPTEIALAVAPEDLLPRALSFWPQSQATNFCSRSAKHFAF